MSYLKTSKSKLVAQMIMANSQIAKTVTDFQFNGNYQMSSCNYHILSCETGKDKVVIEQTAKTTTSITNKIEDIVQAICDAESISPDTHNFYEYYPCEIFKEAIYELLRVNVELSNNSSLFSKIFGKLKGRYATLRSTVYPA